MHFMPAYQSNEDSWRLELRFWIKQELYLMIYVSTSKSMVF